MKTISKILTHNNNKFLKHCNNLTFSVKLSGRNVPKTPINPLDSSTILPNIRTVYSRHPIIAVSTCDAENFPFNSRLISGGNTRIHNYRVETQSRRGTIEKLGRTFTMSKTTRALANHKRAIVNLPVIVVTIVSIDWYQQSVPQVIDVKIRRYSGTNGHPDWRNS